MKLPKILLITWTFPPYVNGAAILLGNLFQELNPHQFAVLTREPDPLEPRVDEASRLRCRYYRCNTPKVLSRLTRRISAVHLTYALVPYIVLRGLIACWRERVDVLVATINGQGAFQVAAYFIHRISGKPLYLYVIDVFEETYVRADRFAARLFERALVRKATKIFVMNEGLQEHYRRKHQMETVLLPSSISLEKVEPPSLSAASPVRKDAAIILYSGHIYPVYTSGLQAMVAALDGLLGSRVRLVLCTAVSRERLEAMGLVRNGIESHYYSRTTVLAAQRRADILFLPFAFDAQYHPKIPPTTFSTKIVEYFCAGRPILVYGPPRWQVCKYVHRHGCALVVDQPDVRQLRNAVLSLLEDDNLRRRLVTKAWDRAQRHDAKRTAEILRTHLLSSK